MPKFEADKPINVIVKPKSVSSTVQRKKKPLKFAKAPAYLKRIKNDGFINFYDCGQVLDFEGLPSGWRDLPLMLIPDWEIVTTFPTSRAFNFSDFTISHHQQVRDYLFQLEPDLTKWKNTFRKVPYETGYHYGIVPYQGRGTILDTGSIVHEENTLKPDVNPEWTKDGLKPLESWIQVAFTGGLGLTFSTGGDPFYSCSYKVTREYNYSADGVTIDVSKGANIYIIPKFNFNTGFHEFGIDGGFRRYTLFAHWTVKSRELFLDKTMKRFSDDNVEIPIFEGYFGTVVRSDNPAYMETSQWIQDWFAQEAADLMRRSGFAGRNPTLYAQHGTNASGTLAYYTLPPADFPAGGEWINVTFTQNFEARMSWGSSGTTGDHYQGPGILCAIVEVSGIFYYVWSNVGFIQTFWPSVAIRTDPTE